MKHLLTAGLRSRVAQRLFLLFLFAALVPAAGLALLSYQQVSSMLIDLNYHRLQQDAKAMGMGLIQRLMWREEALLRHQAADMSKPRGNIEDAKGEFLAVEFPGAEILDTLKPEQINHLLREKVLLETTPEGKATMTAALMGTSGYVRVQLETASLWDDEFAGGEYCFLMPAGRVLFCSPGMPVPPAEQWRKGASGDRNSGIFAWQVEGEEHLAAYWRIPLQASLGHDGFIVVVSESRADVLSVLDEFRQVFPAFVLLAMALAAWLAIGQIRRQMRPLDLLERHTRQLAQGDFSERVEVQGDDEFARLASAFNRMSANLDHKFHLLNALGELDRAILSASEMDSVIRLLLQHVPLAVTCDSAGVLRFEGDSNILLWAADPGLAKADNIHLVCEDAHGFPVRAEADAWFGLDLSAPEARSLQHFAKQGATQALIFPACVGKRLDSALVLAYREAPPEMDEIVQAGRSLADRLAAAAFSISWEDKLYRQAHYDALTGLPNRTLLRDRVEQALLRAERENLAVALMLIDLDKFKDINDSLGHSTGDALLVACAGQLKNVARHTDTVARFGGDEFVVLIPDLPHATAAAIVDRIASELGETLARPIDLAGREISSTASIGIALYPGNGTEIEELLKNADAAMYETKRERHGGHRFYSDQMNLEIKVRFEMAQDLRKAMDNNEFFLVYQPKIEAATGRVVGAEALIRWASPRLGLVSPANFIPMIDDIGLGNRLGQWVMETACQQMKAWDAVGMPPLTVSVNASPAQFRTDAIITEVNAALRANTLPADRLELEILESMAVGESGGINDYLEGLRQLGVGIALDDFGTGYSSLVYLTQLPANVLKIDRGFIIDVLDDPRKQAIVERIISLAKVLNYTVVAEGIEEEAQARMLGRMGCDLFQGYYFSKPLKPDDFEAFVRAWGAVSPAPTFPAG
ncbi:MAG: EAL domain-containing protein [Pseudomonadota bacterium]